MKLELNGAKIFCERSDINLVKKRHLQQDLKYQCAIKSHPQTSLQNSREEIPCGINGLAGVVYNI
jgi:hypothetical protein